MAARRTFIAPNVALNYARNPIVVLRGEAQHLYDEVRPGSGRGQRPGAVCDASQSRAPPPHFPSPLL